MDNKKLLGKRIKELRKSCNLTQEKLAELINIETTSLSGIESGRHFPSMVTVEKIAKSLKVDLRTLFDFNYLSDIGRIKKEIINSLDEMDEEKIRFIYRFLNL